MHSLKIIKSQIQFTSVGSRIKNICAARHIVQISITDILHWCTFYTHDFNSSFTVGFKFQLLPRVYGIIDYGVLHYTGERAV